MTHPEAEGERIAALRAKPNWTTLEKFLLDQAYEQRTAVYQDAATLLYQQRLEIATLRAACDALTRERDEALEALGRDDCRARDAEEVCHVLRDELTIARNTCDTLEQVAQVRLLAIQAREAACDALRASLAELLKSHNNHAPITRHGEPCICAAHETARAALAARPSADTP